MTAVRNVRWLATSSVTRAALQFGALAIYSRALPREDFGLVAAAMVVLNFGSILLELGSASLLVQRNDGGSRLASTVFWVNLCLSTTIFTCVCAARGWIEGMFHADGLARLIPLFAASIFLSGFGAVPQALHERANRFRLLTGIELTAAVVSFGVGMVVLRIGGGVYAMAAQHLCSALVISTALFATSPWKPRLEFDWSQFRSVWGYSTFMAAFNFVNFFTRNMDSILIGRNLGLNQLGVYSQAYKVMLLPLQHTTFLAARALFPVLSRLQDDAKAGSTLYLRALRMIATFTAPLMMGLWVLRHEFIGVVLSPRWQDVAVLLGFLAPVGFIQSMTSSAGAVFLSKGRTDLLFMLGVIGAVLQLGGILAGLHWGIVGVAAGYMVGNVVNFLPCFHVTAGQFGLRLSDVLRALARPVAAAAIMGVLLMGATVGMHALSAPVIVVLVLGTLFGVGFYFVALKLVAPDAFADVWRMLKLRGAQAAEA